MRKEATISQLGDLFAAAERTLFELLTWIVMIPKTLFMVLSRPGDVPAFVRDELERAKDESYTPFEGAVSPGLLFLFMALVPLLLVTVIDQPRLAIHGPTSGTAGREVTLQIDLSEIPDGTAPLQTVWTFDDRTKHRCYRNEVLVYCEVLEAVLAIPDLEDVLTELEDILDPEWAAIRDRRVGQHGAEITDTVTALLTESDFNELAQTTSLSLAHDSFMNERGEGVANLLASWLCDEWSVDDLNLTECVARSSRWSRAGAIVVEARSIDEVRAELANVGFEGPVILEGMRVWCDDRANETSAPVEGCLRLRDAEMRLVAEGGLGEVSEAADAFLSEGIRWTPARPGTYEVSVSVRALATGALLDQSRPFRFNVRPVPARSVASGGFRKDTEVVASSVKASRAERTETAKAAGTPNPLEWLQDSKTVGFALLFLALPLSLALITDLRRDRPLTRATLKPAFYIQCLYLSPVIAAVWMPQLLLHFSPRVDQLFGFALLLNIAILLWFAVVQVRFVAAERGISRKSVALWLVVLPFALLMLIGFLETGALHVYDVVEALGAFAMLLLISPFVISAAMALLRRVRAPSQPGSD